MNKNTEVFEIYKVTLPTYALWPGKTILYVGSTYGDCQRFIEDYPYKLIVGFLQIEQQEIIIHND